MIDHIYLPVKDIDRSLQFYAALLTPLDFAGRWDFKGQDGWPDLYGFGGDRPRFWLKRSTTTFPELYVAFIATSKEAVEKAYAAALAAGGQAERPRVRRVGDIPQLDRAVAVAAGQRVRVGAERHRGVATAAGQGLAERPRVRQVGDIPQPDRAVVVDAGQRVPVGAECYRADAVAAGGQAERPGVRRSRGWSGSRRERLSRDCRRWCGRWRCRWWRCRSATRGRTR
jgi:catechol 2,3-dioxygenase-like lactoylglutathione lyase family enzyme